MKSILDRSFQYTPSAATDVRKTFERARQQLEAKAAATSKVVTLPSRSAKASTSAGQA